MKSPLVFITAALALFAFGLGALSWRQHLELIRLRGAALDTGERAELQKQVADAETRARTVEARALAATFPAAAPEIADSDNLGDTPKPAAVPKPPKKGPSQSEILAFLSDPQIQQELAGKFRGLVEARYASLFKSLNLPAAQQTRLRELLIERQGAAVDVAAALLTQGGKTKEKDLQLLVANAQDETDRKLLLTLGTEVYAKFQTYENAQLFRGATTDLQRNLARVQAPLNAAQAEQFTAGVTALAQSSFTPAQQLALRTFTRNDQSKDTLRQVEQLYKEKQSPPKPAKSPK